MTRSDTPSARDRRVPPRDRPLRSVPDAMYALVRWTVDHARGVYAAMGIFLAVGLAAATLAAAAFALIAHRMVGGATQRFDAVAVEWAGGHATPLLDALAILGAALGSGTATWIALGAGSVFLWVTRHHFSVLLLWISLVGGRWLSHALKELFDRPRPAPTGWDLEVFGHAIGFPSSPSFPSGHAVTSVVVYGTLAYLVVRLEPTVRLRRLTLAAAALLILLIGLSRIYLGVHYPSDVAAGFLAGFVWICFSAFTIEVLRYFARRRPEVAREEGDLEKGLQPIRSALHGDGRN